MDIALRIFTIISPSLILLLSMVTAVCGTVASILAAWHAWRNSIGIARIQIEVNGRMQEMLRLTALSSKAEGVLAGKDTEYERNRRDHPEQHS